MLRKVLLTVFVSALLAGCAWEMDAGSWDLAGSTGTGIDPTVGQYSFSPYGCFSVIEESGKKYVRFSSDCARFDKFEIIDGAFYHEWGQIDGIHCPSDGYAISGAFSSKTSASGIIKHGFDCNIGRTENFNATLK